jgi:CRP-like cAMP-binding protein
MLGALKALAPLLLSPDFYFTLIGLLESLALLASSLLLFRFCSISVSLSYIFLVLWVGLKNPGMMSILMGAVLDIGINVFMISSYFYARSIISLQPGWREAYRAYFSILLPFEFRRLLTLSEFIVVEQSEPRLIVRAGAPFERLYFLLEGTADLVLADQALPASLVAGDWIAEFSMLTGRPTSADVVGTSLRLLSWNAAAIERLKGSMPEVFEKVNALIARNLCDKLVRGNQLAKSAQVEPPA